MAGLVININQRYIMKYKLIFILILISSISAYYFIKVDNEGIKQEKLIELSFPVACNIGQDCFVQKYVDHFEEKDVIKDYKCQMHRSSDNHKGTDIRVIDAIDIEKGVPILSIADGVVIKKRDGIDDKFVTNKEEADKVNSFGYGNVLVIKHNHGYNSLYAHMKKGSLIPEIGDKVYKGQKIAEMGISGLTEFPHLHFEILHNDKILDPFTGTQRKNDCDISTINNLWAKEDYKKLIDSQDARIVKTGFSTTQDIDKYKVMHGEYDNIDIKQDDEKILFWTYIMLPELADKALITLYDPRNKVISREEYNFKKSFATFFQYIGKKKKKDELWQEGNYRGEVQLIRNGQIISKDSKYIEINTKK